MAKQTKELRGEYRRAVAHHQKPAIVLDADDTTLWTYDMEVGDMHFVFTPAEQDVWVQDERFPAVPAMVSFVNTAKAMGFTIFGLTGRNDDQKAATLANLEKVGYQGFTSDHYFTKWTGKGASQQPSYVQCAAASCTTVEYKALTRKHIEQDLGYTIVDNLGDQWSDLQGGYAEEQVKLPNPTYYLPSADLPGVSEPRLAPRTHFRMAADGSSGATQGGEGIPNIDSVKKTIATYYGDPGTGIANKTDSPYIREMRAVVRKQAPLVAAQCFVASKQHRNPAIVLDADDTTLWTYDMEVADMHFVFDPALQDEWVQDERFPATPSMTSLVSVAERSGCTIIGLTVATRRSRPPRSRTCRRSATRSSPPSRTATARTTRSGPARARRSSRRTSPARPPSAPRSSTSRRPGRTSSPGPAVGTTSWRTSVTSTAT